MLVLDEPQRQAREIDKSMKKDQEQKIMDLNYMYVYRIKVKGKEEGEEDD